jgi:cysteine desulfurase|tara:strand:- start:1254 stop:2393 length:1140 start_codon:yes stop_codon:yes gene_type:complete
MIYFDHNATTSIHPEVLDTMMPFLDLQQGNPSSNHSFGRNAQTAIELARERVANSVNAHPSEVIFTSSGTESNNTIIHGIARSYPDSHFGFSAIEHPCVSEPIKSIESMGFKNTQIPVDNQGLLNISALSIKEQKSITFLSVMMANNETGVIQDMPSIINWAKSNNIQIHTDAVQAVGKINVDFSELGIDAMTISSHKIYGPQGAAAIILNKKIDLYPHLMGGGQEKGLRSGTENIAAIVGFGKACERVGKNIVINNNELKKERLFLEKELKNLGAVIFAEHAKRLGNTTFFAFNNIDGSTLLTALDRKGYAIASGSACSSNSSDASHVLLAMGTEKELAQGALRISLGIKTKKEEIKSFVKTLKVEINRLKQLTAMAA